MSKPDDSSGGTGETPNRQEAIEADLRERFPGADLKVERYADYLDVRVVPNDLAENIEHGHDGVTVTPYNALKFTIQFEP